MNGSGTQPKQQDERGVVYGGDARGHWDAWHPGDRQYRSGKQLTSESSTALLKDKGIAISMDSKGRAIDNIFIERFWRSLKYEYVYLQPADDGVVLYGGVRYYIDFYNRERLHQSPAYHTPLWHYRKDA